MNKIYLLIMITLSTVLFTACSTNSTRVEMLNNSNNKEIANSTFEKIMDALIDNDEEMLKGVFSQQVLEEDINLENEMSYAFNLFQGDLISWKVTTGPIVDRENNYGEKIEEFKTFYEVETDLGNYLIFILEYTEDTEHPENIGVFALRIIKEEDKEMQFTYWQDMAISGIYMP